VIADSQQAMAAGDVVALAAQVPRMRAARQALAAAITSTDLMLDLLGSVGL
jgi:hypothetical protein